MKIKKGNLNFDQTGRAYPDNPHIEENWDCIWEYEGKLYKLVGDINTTEWSEVTQLAILTSHMVYEEYLGREEEPKDVVLGYKTSIVGQMLDSDEGFGQVGQVIDENTSDGYHTFKELYEFRKAYNVALFNEWAMQNKYDVHKSWKHNDGEECFGGGWFIVVAVLPGGQISNHYEAKDWDLFKTPEVEKAKYPFDGHTGEDVIKRLINI
jgi:hypothetical protein